MTEINTVRPNMVVGFLEYSADGGEDSYMSAGAQPGAAEQFHGKQSNPIELNQ